MTSKYYRRKARAIEHLGGVCKGCGTTKNLQFDHVDRYSKRYPIASMLSGCSWDNIMSELVKCQLLCHPCHVAKGEHGPRVPGSHPHAKLNPAKVQEMRWRHPRETVSSLAKEFGVAHGTASKAINRQTWRHVK